MAKPDESIEPRLLEAARQEFYSQGYEKASTNKICSNASVTTGALFKRYKNKDELFGAVVSSTAEKFKEMLRTQYRSFEEMTIEEQKENAVQTEGHQEPMQFIYDNLEDFRLLLGCAKGSSYENYKDEITDIIAGATISFMQATGSKPILDGMEVSVEVIRYLVGMHQHALFEIVMKEEDYERACIQAKQVHSFFDMAWAGMLQL